MRFSKKILNDIIPDEGDSDYWRALFYYNFYRFCIAIFLITAGLAPINVGSLGSSEPLLFTITAILYAALALISGVFIHQGWPRYITTCQLIIASDLLFYTLLIYTSGGFGSGLEILLVISVAASGILMGGRGAFGAASVATLLLLSTHLAVIALGLRNPGGFTSLGFLGLGLFVTAFFIHYLSARLRVSEEQLIRHQLNIHNLNQLNQYIINKLHSGILVIDNNQYVWLDNQRARTLFNVQKRPFQRQRLAAYSPALIHATQEWIRDPNKLEQKVVLDKDTTLLVRFQPIGKLNPDKAFIMLIDDMSQVEKEKQNEKLIAMGHLTASIAHEIRNPLGAISHAGQLMAESSDLKKDDTRLVEIINMQSNRVNRIIQTTLELGRPATANRQRIIIFDWLSRLVEEFVRRHKIYAKEVEMDGDHSLVACFDPDQMQQVVTNILENGVRHADRHKEPLVTIRLTKSSRDNCPQIRIYDSGPGISDELRYKIFEPFFTTSSNGSGLGLYVARHICIGNDGNLEYQSDSSGTGYFCITLLPCTENDEPQHTN